MNFVHTDICRFCFKLHPFQPLYQITHVFSLNCRCMQDSLKHIFINQCTMVHSLVNRNPIHTCTKHVHLQIDSWALAHCSGHFLNTTTPMMRYRAGASHRTLIYKRLRACCHPRSVFHRHSFSSLRGEENSQGLGGKVWGSSKEEKHKKNKLLGSLPTKVNLEENVINSRMGLTNQIKHIWICQVTDKQFLERDEEKRGGRTEACLQSNPFTISKWDQITAASNAQLFFLNSRSI